ncbi:MAG: sulfatase-like hydrolase/transferase [Opitutales bacterium]
MILRLFFILVCSLGVLSADRPNIVFILTDDQRDNSFSGMGHPWVQTPHVDRLLEESTRFQNAYIAEPTCRPSRAAIYLGCHERVNHQGFSSKVKMNAEQWSDSFPALLQEAGYHTGFVGKWHVSNAKGVRLRNLFDFVDGHEGHGMFYYPQEDGTVLTTNEHFTNKAIEYLESRDTNPFFLSICFSTPHGSKLAKMHEVLDEPAHQNPHLKDHPIYGQMYRELSFEIPFEKGINPYDHIPKSVMNQDKGRNRTYHYNYEEGKSREHYYRYYQMITEIDLMVHRVVSALERLELDEETLIVFGSDHGLLMGEYGMGGKGLVYDLSSKFPCFIYDPSAPKATRGQVRDELVSSLDIATTLLDYAGVEKSAFMYGASLKTLVQSTETPETWRTGLFLENLYTGRDTPMQAGYVENGWKYVAYSKARNPYTEDDLNLSEDSIVFEQLFDLRSDPEEERNLIDSPEFAETLARLKQNTQSEVDRLNMKRAEYRARYFTE